MKKAEKSRGKTKTLRCSRKNRNGVFLKKYRDSAAVNLSAEIRFQIVE